MERIARTNISRCLRGLAFLLLGFFPFVSSGLGQESSGDSAVVMLPCDGKCAAITRDVNRISGAPPYINDAVNGALRPDGVVELRYTIHSDGSVGDDISTVTVIGPTEFEEAAKRSVRSYRYTPAIVNGEPVAISHTVRFIFNRSPEKGARPSFVTSFEEVPYLLKLGKLDEARAKLEAIYALQTLNFFERGYVLYPLILIAQQQGRYEEVRKWTRIAINIPRDNYLPGTFRNILRARILANLQANDIVGAVNLVEYYKQLNQRDEYKKLPDYKADDPLIKQVDDARKTMEVLPSFSVNARIPDVSEGGDYQIQLLRRYFAFTNIKGTLDEFRIACRQREWVSPISEKAEWTVPKDVSDCCVFMKGAPGTTFQLVQFTDPPPNSQEVHSR